MEDSRIDTWEHIGKVQTRIDAVIENLLQRAREHDLSKLEPPEREAYTELSTRLAGVTYGSEEYRECLRELGPALDHHYAANRHHPEHWAAGVDGMSLLDIMEMLCDWKAASERHDDGDIFRSIEANAERFHLTPQLTRILVNTAKELGYGDG